MKREIFFISWARSSIIKTNISLPLFYRLIFTRNFHSNRRFLLVADTLIRIKFVIEVVSLNLLVLDQNCEHGYSLISDNRCFRSFNHRSLTIEHNGIVGYFEFFKFSRGI